MELPIALMKVLERQEVRVKLKNKTYFETNDRINCLSLHPPFIILPPYFLLPKLLQRPHRSYSYSIAQRANSARISDEMIRFIEQMANSTKELVATVPTPTFFDNTRKMLEQVKADINKLKEM